MDILGNFLVELIFQFVYVNGVYVFGLDDLYSVLINDDNNEEYVLFIFFLIIVEYEITYVIIINRVISNEYEKENILN